MFEDILGESVYKEKVKKTRGKKKTVIDLTEPEPLEPADISEKDWAAITGHNSGGQGQAKPCPKKLS